jgi:hypothetical protein
MMDDGSGGGSGNQAAVDTTDSQVVELVAAEN